MLRSGGQKLSSFLPTGTVPHQEVCETANSQRYAPREPTYRDYLVLIVGPVAFDQEEEAVCIASEVGGKTHRTYLGRRNSAPSRLFSTIQIPRP